MLLCLDIGNTHILGGVFKQAPSCAKAQDPVLIARFRYATHLIGTADQFGLFLIQILQANNIVPEKITSTAVSSVVPSYDYTIRHTISLYLPHSTYFLLQAGAKTGLNIKYKNPNEVGADRIANAIGAIHVFPNQHIIIIDMGTATTLDAVTNKRDYLGGAILPGMRLSMESLHKHTAKLVEVDIEAPKNFIGRTTRESIQSGLYYGHLGAIKEIIHGMKREMFKDEPVLIIGTGGFTQLFRHDALFDNILPDLVLQGLCKAHENSLQHEKK